MNSIRETSAAKFEAAGALVVGRKLCVRRCFIAVACGIAVQYFLFGLFLACANFEKLHPFASIGLLLLPRTWVNSFPLICGIIIYSLFLSKSFLAVNCYYPTRFQWLVQTSPFKFLFLCIHVMVGGLTTWLYTDYIHPDYRDIVCECFGSKCINPRYLFLLCVGISSAIYHFIQVHLSKDPIMEFPIVQELVYVKMRAALYSTPFDSLIKSFVPIVCFGFGYWLLGGLLNKRLAHHYGIDMDEGLQTFFQTAGNVRLLFYGWILAAQILCNMHLLQQFFSILLAEELTFTIENKPFLCTQQSEEITIVDALSMRFVPVIESLGALDVYNLGNPESKVRRQELFSLSRPGGHPYNWNSFSLQCMGMINTFTEELTESMKNISAVKCAPLFQNMRPATASEAAQRIMMRQYNDMHGIRRLATDEARATIAMSPYCKRVHDQVESFSKQMRNSLTRTFYSIPGVFYMFGELDGGKTAFLLLNSQNLAWVVQGMARLCVASITEDMYGVVQDTLPQFIKSLLTLKTNLDKLNNVNLNGIKMDRNFITLKGVVKRSLYQICTAFRECLQDIIDDAEQLQMLQCYMNYQDV